jgi:hypothetical protein
MGEPSILPTAAGPETPAGTGPWPAAPRSFPGLGGHRYDQAQ